MCKAISSTIVVVFNFAFIVVGLALVIFGSLIKWKKDMLVDKIVPSIIEDVENPNEREAAQEVMKEILSFFSNYGLVIFLFGLFLFLLSFCGICGVCCKSKLLLGFYAALLLIIFLALLIFTIVFGTRTGWFKNELGVKYKEFIVRGYHMDNENPPNAGLTVLINNMQHKHHCCGSFDINDYQENESFRNQRYRIPASCCKNMNDRECWVNPTPENSYKDTGCFQFLWSTIRPHYSYILYALIGLLVLTFFFATIAIYLLTRYSREEMRIL